MTRVIAVVGRPAVGKSVIARLLAARLEWDVLSIDGERSRGGDWPTLCRKVAALVSPALVESVLFPAAYRRALAHHDAGLLVVKCQEAQRRERLRGRPAAMAGSRGDRYWLADRRSIDTTLGIDRAALARLAGWARASRPGVSRVSAGAWFVSVAADPRRLSTPGRTR